LEKEAAELLVSITRREAPPPQAEPDDALESLARLIVARLGRWQAPGQGKPGAGEPPTTE